MEFGLKRVHIAPSGLILKLDGALWLGIILKPLLTPKGAIKKPKNPKKSLKARAKPAKEGYVPSPQPGLILQDLVGDSPVDVAMSANCAAIHNHQ